jgi:hypothetical protein
MKTIALALIGSLAVACAPAIKSGPAVQTVTAARAALPQFHTFAFGLTEDPPAGYEASPRSLEVEQRMQALVGSELQQKGYVQVSARPDFIVRFAAGTVRIDPGPVTEENTDVAPYTLRKIDVDVYDASSKTEVWRGSATSQVAINKYVDPSLLQRDVHGALASFPVGTPSASEPMTAPLARGESNPLAGK